MFDIPLHLHVTDTSRIWRQGKQNKKSNRGREKERESNTYTHNQREEEEEEEQHTSHSQFLGGAGKEYSLGRFLLWPKFFFLPFLLHEPTLSLG